MKILFSGGCKNSKSTWAERTAFTLSAGGPLYYIATMIPHDAEDEARIRHHVQSRAGLGFVTLECGRDVLRCLDMADAGGAFLLDSVTALLANEMFDEAGRLDEAAPERVAASLEALAARVRHIVFVSDYIYADALSYDETTEAYRRGLALLDRRLAALADGVAELVAGRPFWHKGGMPE